MSKVLLLSGLVGLIVAPVVAARASSPRKALKALILYTAVTNILYLLGLRFIYPHLG